MKVWVVEKCCCDEYGCMELVAVCASKEDALRVIEERGLQMEDEGVRYGWRYDFASIRECEVIGS